MNPAALFSLQGKRALITGSAQGIGLALARALGAAGAELLLNDRAAEPLAGAAEELRREGLRVSTGVFDVSDEAQVIAGVARLEEGGAIDILVNNAGIHRRSPLVEMTLADWQRVLEVNLTSAFLVARAVAPGMIARRSGKIINLASVNCEVARPGIANYSAAKGGLKMLTRSMAVEWAQHNIQANAIGPGYLLTELTRPLAENAEFDRWIRARTPAGRWGRADDLAGAVVFLAAPASDFVNGQTLYIDGGLLAAL